MNLYIIEKTKIKHAESVFDRFKEDEIKLFEKMHVDFIPYYRVYTDYIVSDTISFSFGIALDYFDTQNILWIDESIEYKKFVVKNKYELREFWHYIKELEEKNEIIRAFLLDYEKINEDGSAEVYISVLSN